MSLSREILNYLRASLFTTVVIGEPITVTESNFAEAEELLVERMANH